MAQSYISSEEEKERPAEEQRFMDPNTSSYEVVNTVEVPYICGNSECGKLNMFKGKD